MDVSKLTREQRDGLGAELNGLYDEYVSFLHHPFVKHLTDFCNEQRDQTDRVWDYLKPSEHIDEEQFKRKLFEELAYGVMFKRAYERKHSQIKRKWTQEATRQRDIDTARGL